MVWTFWCSFLQIASDVDGWKGPWAGYEGEEEDRMTSVEKVSGEGSGNYRIGRADGVAAYMASAKQRQEGSRGRFYRLSVRG